MTSQNAFIEKNYLKLNTEHNKKFLRDIFFRKFMPYEIW